MFIEHKEAGEAERSRENSSPPVTKLSEAIREGSKLRPKCTGFLFIRGRSCALGAAYEALGHAPVEGHIGKPGYDEQYDALYRLFGRNICERVSSRNDRGDTREQIADWLESQGL